MQIKLRGKRVGVEKLKSTKREKSFIAMPESEEFSGVVRYVSEEAAKDIKVGDKVVYGNQFQQVKLEGSVICVMDDSNIMATLNENTEQVTT